MQWTSRSWTLLGPGQVDHRYMPTTRGCGGVQFLSTLGYIESWLSAHLAPFQRLFNMRVARGFSWLVSLCFVPWMGQSLCASDEATISVSGNAEIRVVPDEVVLTAAVESRAKTVADALRD